MRHFKVLALARLFAGIAVITVAAQAATPASPDLDPTYYICAVTRTGAFGQIWYAMNVPVDGSAPYHRINWQIPPRAEGLKLWVQSDGAAPVDGRLDDRTTVFVYFETSHRIGGEVRIEIRRTPGERYGSEFAYAGPFRRLYRWPDRGLYYIETQGRWGELSAWMSGRDALTFALVRRDGRVMAEDRLDATTLDGAASAIAAVRPEVEAMAADYRHRCTVPGPVVVT